MTQPSEKKIKELRKIIKEDYDREVAPEEACKIEEPLVEYFDLLGKIYYKIKINDRREKGEH